MPLSSFFSRTRPLPGSVDQLRPRVGAGHLPSWRHGLDDDAGLAGVPTCSLDVLTGLERWSPVHPAKLGGPHRVAAGAGGPAGGATQPHSLGVRWSGDSGSAEGARIWTRADLAGQCAVVMPTLTRGRTPGERLNVIGSRTSRAMRRKNEPSKNTPGFTRGDPVRPGTRRTKGSRQAPRCPPSGCYRAQGGRSPRHPASGRPRA